MPRKLKLSYKKHASVTTRSGNSSPQNSCSTQTERITTCCDETQTEKTITCDVSVQSEREDGLGDVHLLTPSHHSFVVKLNINFFYSLHLDTVDQLCNRLTHLTSINNWYLVPGKFHEDRLQLVKLGSQQCSFAVEVTKEMKWFLQLPNGLLSSENCCVLENLPEKITSLNDLKSALSFIDQCTICNGNNDPKFAPIVAQHKGVFKDRKGTAINAYFDQSALTIRHVSCHWLLTDPTKQKCPVCVQYRENFLRSKLRSLNHSKQDATDPSSHVNYRYLDTPEKLTRMKNLHSLVRKQSRQIHGLHEKLRKTIDTSGIKVGDAMHTELSTLMDKFSETVTKQHGEESFQSIFWTQQLNALSAKKKTAIRWHPLIIRWALYLHYKSSGAYETLRKSGVIFLPTTRTLQDYRHFSSHCEVGFTAAADHQLLALIKQKKPTSLAHYVFLLMDEMYLKEGLIYEKSTGALIGFADLDGVVQQLEEHERALSGNGKHSRQLAKTMMVIMVRGVFSDICFPYAQFPMCSPNAGNIFPLIWKAIGRLECNDIKVLGITCDGASINRRFLKLHGNSYTNKTTNIYSTDNRSILFFIDPPHLLKTIRNAIANRSRHLWCNGQSISWQYIRELYERNLGSESNVGVSLAHKLTLEHIQLTSFSKMRVDLAAQVMSSSVSKALLFSKKSEVFETAHFIDKVDKFFDSLNVSNFTGGKHTRKRYQEPYSDPEDERLEFLQNFVKYLKNWQSDVDKREGYDKKQKKMMVLPEETTSGINITVSSFVDLLPFLFTIPGVTGFLSNKINQDPLEKFFGIQRQAGRSNDNPTVYQFIKNTDSIRVINSIWIDDIVGNCRGRRSKKHIDIEAAKMPLQKRKRRKSV